jgi:alkanesulfonate monooxygenase SsuD/methylene tetrahydromethanopterin reductase-like flavin-dependent oxidoreductase (luciferase family)
VTDVPTPGSAGSPDRDRPAVSLVATPRRRADILDLAVEAERRGFPGIACPSLGGAMALCVSLSHVTRSIGFRTAVQPIYYAHASELATTASHIDEISGGRFALGIGVSHDAVTRRLRVETGRPLADIADYVSVMRANERFGGKLPPLHLAAMRDRMLALATEIADGAIWANASLAHTPSQIARVGIPEGFALSNMIPTVIDDDRAAADAINRRTMRTYVQWPNYRNYWRSAGYAEEMDAIEAALGDGSSPPDDDAVRAAMSDRWLRDCTVGGPVALVRERFEQWRAIGVLPIAVMSSTGGGQAKAVRELFDAYA